MAKLKEIWKKHKKNFKIIIPILFALIFSVISITSISNKSATRDEDKHLVRGVMLIETGDYRLNKHHPILANVITAIPQKFNPNLEVPQTEDSELWDKADKDGLAWELQKINSGDDGTNHRKFVYEVLNLSRYVVIVFMALSGIGLYFLVKEEFGFIVAILFSVLYYFSPNIIAHSRLVTTDSMIIPVAFWSTFELFRYFKYGKNKFLILFGISALLSILIKYSALPLIFFWTIALIIHEFNNSQYKKILKRIFNSIKKPALLILTWFILLTAAYGFNFKTLQETNYQDYEKINAHLSNFEALGETSPTLSKAVTRFYRDVKLPFPEYIQGFLENVIFHDIYGHDSYLWGQYSSFGWWYYFPVAMATKMPVPILLGILCLIGYGIYTIYSKVKTGKRLKEYTKLKPVSIFIIIPVLYFLLSINSSINLGLRHILVIFPFIYLGLAVLSKKALEKLNFSKFIIPSLLIWYVIASFSIHPHYIEYFNVIVGGPKNGYKYLLDSNLSWGQDKFYVEDYIDRLDTEKKIYINPKSEVEEGIVIVDIDYLLARTQKNKEKINWLREPYLDGDIIPTDRIAYTYMVFELD